MEQEHYLVAFQRNLDARLQQADARRAAVSRLGFLAGGQNWLADLVDISGVLAAPAVVPVPLTRAWFRGISHFRGGIYSVVDFSGFCGGQPFVDGPETCLILLRGAARCGLAVERILGICDAESLKPEPGAAAGYVAGEYAGKDGRRWRGLNVKELDRDPAFLAIAMTQTDHAH